MSFLSYDCFLTNYYNWSCNWTKLKSLVMYLVIDIKIKSNYISLAVGAVGAVVWQLLLVLLGHRLCQTLVAIEGGPQLACTSVGERRAIGTGHGGARG